MVKFIEFKILLIAVIAAQISSCSESPIEPITPENSRLMTFNVSKEIQTKSTRVAYDDGVAIPENWYGLTSTGEASKAYNEASTPTTRADVTGFVEGNSIGVLAYKLEDATFNSTIAEPASGEVPDVMYKQQVTLNSEKKWEYSPIKEWPENYNHKVKFFGYYPYNHSDVTVETHADEAGYPKFGFTSHTPTEEQTQTEFFASQIDLLYSETAPLNNAATNYGFASMSFKHALSKVRFMAELKDGVDQYSREMTIKSIKFNYPTKAVMQPNGSSVSWNEHSNNSDYAFAQYTTNTGGETTEGKLLTTDQQWLIGGDDPSEALLMVPPADPNAKITATITYDLKYTLRPGDPYFETLINITDEVELPAWVAGKSQTYQLTVDFDNFNPTIKVDLIFGDWQDSFDINTDVIYTYLYVEKPEFTHYYYESKPIETSIYFRTNAPDDEISIEVERTPEEKEEVEKRKDPAYSPASGFPRLENRLELDVANQVVNCTFIPNLGYNEEVVTIQAGIVSIKIKVVFIPQEPYYLMDDTYLNLLMNLPSDTPLTDRHRFANSYFLQPDPDPEGTGKFSRKFFIPINYQIEHLWGDEGRATLNADSWSVQLYAYDNEHAVNDIVIQKEADMGGAPWTGTGADPRYKFDTFSITIPDVYTNYGNILVTVTDQTNKILWTWHFWVTDYDPYEIFNDNNITAGYVTSTEVIAGKSYVRSSTTYAGSAYRHVDFDYSWWLDRNIGATKPTFDGHGGYGSRGWLIYQYGRVAPILGHSAKYADGTFYTTSIKNIYSQADQVTLQHAISNPNEMYYSPTGLDWCSENRSGYVWNDPILTHPTHDPNNIYSGHNSSDTEAYYQKSIYDPSPLGYMVPPLKEYGPTPADGFNPWSLIGSSKNDYQMSNGNSFFASNNLNPQTGEISLSVLNYFYVWTNSSYSDNKRAGSMDFEAYTTTPNARWKFDTYRTLGAPIRCIDQFEVK